MTLYFNNSMSFYLQHTLKSTHINLDTFGKLANLRRDSRQNIMFSHVLNLFATSDVKYLTCLVL